MFSFLKNHPFAVEAYFDSSIVFTFAIPKEEVQALIPECLTLDTWHDKWAFIAIAMVQTKDLRPKGFPGIFGNDFFLIGYRVFVRFTTQKGKKLKGLYILKSETDKKKMEFFGNLFTQYQYGTTDISIKTLNDITEIGSVKSGFSVKIKETSTDAVDLPAGSPFADWKEARRFAGPLPFTFTYDPKKKEVLIIEGVRQHWKPKPVQVLKYSFSFLSQLQLKEVRLANAFVIRDIPYMWKQGKTEQWNPKEEPSKVF